MERHGDVLGCLDDENHTAIWWQGQGMLNGYACMQQPHPKCQRLPYGKPNQPQNVGRNLDAIHRKAKGSFSVKAVEPHGHAATQPYGKVAGQPCSCANCGRIAMLPYTHAAKQLHSHAIMQLCGHVAKQS